MHCTTDIIIIFRFLIGCACVDWRLE